MKLGVYERLSLETFGALLLDTLDLDPVYVALDRLQLNDSQLRQWLFAYWCCYHCGVASYLSEVPASEFWKVFTVFAANVDPSPLDARWPRGRERRHFRGNNATTAAAWFERTFDTPEAAVRTLELPGSFSRIRTKVLAWPQFGPWIAFKVGDMLETVVGLEIDFTNSGFAFYDEPSAAALLWAEQQNSGVSARTAVVNAITHLKLHLSHRLAPPKMRRLLTEQEYETILCKWKSHQNGIYPVGIDTLELAEAIEPWGAVSPTAGRMFAEVEKILNETIDTLEAGV